MSLVLEKGWDTVETYFYDIPQEISLERIDPQIIEKTLAEMESDFLDAFNDVLKTIDRKTKLKQSQ